MAPAIIEVNFPLNKITSEDYASDEYLLNCMGKVNDTPEEDGMPLRAWVIKEAHDALVKNPKLREVVVKPTAVKNSSTHFRVVIEE
ncbi:hypothetical protein DQ04_06571040 [Trypanosoma grayi]|uniref:hypothetical protein n=1 Tax=Trypanosoma grayi TaxID=71804 RepID=UPI0004F43B6D|nr:hypothetical protein DQ04_06571040 [Trypanosoma grayi]KEG08722.1 hypothetical protein DQ04_06571040 [Trypanosoma grayi]